jgi:hypothetical protein
VPFRLTWAAARAEYGLITHATEGAAATLPSMAVIWARTCGARTLPGLTQITGPAVP